MFIKKLYNDLDTLVDESIAGSRLMANDPYSYLLPNSRITARKPEYRKPPEYVKLAGGGGAGHEGPPRGFCRPGGSDAGVTGDVFTAPSATQLLRAVKEAYGEGPGPVLMNVANHAGDVLNTKLCIQLAKAQGIDTRMSIMYTDVASAPKERMKERRGLMGCFQCAGMMAEWGEPIEEIMRVNEKLNTYARAYGVGIRSAIHPMTGLKIMEMPDDEIELGIGGHGESSGNRIKLPRCKELAVMVADILLNDLEAERGEEIGFGLHGLGGMTWMELNILYKDLYEYMVLDKGLKWYRPGVGNSGTQELGGFVVSISRIDDEVKKWVNMPLPERYNKI
jgi:phosphoenolpyruvate---glycerone phosphotransferase subunit DhaK